MPSPFRIALMSHLAEFGSRALQLFRHSAPCDVVHAIFFMSTLVAIEQRAGALAA